MGTLGSGLGVTVADTNDRIERRPGGSRVWRAVNDEYVWHALSNGLGFTEQRTLAPSTTIPKTRARGRVIQLVAIVVVVRKAQLALIR